jgi:hypothetical protein
LIDCQWMICIKSVWWIDWLAVLDSMVWCPQLGLLDSVLADELLTSCHVHSRGIFCPCNNPKHVRACTTNHMCGPKEPSIFLSRKI